MGTGVRLTVPEEQTGVERVEKSFMDPCDRQLLAADAFARKSV